MWKNLILEIEKIEKSFNDKLNTPVTDSEVQKLRERMKESFNVDLPSEYEEFLKTVNRLDFNGLVLYGVDSYLLDMEYRDMVGDESSDKIAPIITTIQELGKLVEPVGLIILPDFEDGIRRVGLIFNCTWEEDGVGVKFENEQVVEVGYQDIVI